MLFVCDPGLEAVTAEEIRELWPSSGAEPDGAPMSGWVRARLPGDADPTRARTVHDVIDVSVERVVKSLDDVRRVVGDLHLSALENASSFRVTAHRAGDHAFSSDELAGAVGAALQRRHGTRVDLRRFEVNVRAELREARLVVGVQRNAKELSKRIRRPRPLRTAVKASIAAAMVRMAGAHHGWGSLSDPMCGSGTILVEAAEKNRLLRVTGADWDARTVEVARGTLAHHGLDVPVVQRDVAELPHALEEPLDFLVTDPPYGIRQGSRIRLDEFYARMLGALRDSLASGGRLVLISPRRRAIERAASRCGLVLLDERPVRAGGLTPRIWTFENR